ncbi:rod shape-determining protein [Sessilibacter corallicola]|uniref:Rod shape-determining protein n=2 Tax=Sessilibacter corallicola TaxID=2904075 RepID=A0ABQ0A768_9GAMM
MIKYIQGKMSKDLYVQVWEDRLKVSSVDKTFDEEPLMALKPDKKGELIVVAIGNSVKALVKSEYETIVNPFKHPRLLVHDFTVAEKIIMHVFRLIHESKIFLPSPRVIFQPMEKLEGGVTTVEERVYKELCFGAGAREVFIHTGNPLSIYDIDFKQFKSDNSE